MLQPTLVPVIVLFQLELVFQLVQKNLFRSQAPLLLQLTKRYMHNFIQHITKNHMMYGMMTVMVITHLRDLDGHTNQQVPISKRPFIPIKKEVEGCTLLPRPHFFNYFLTKE